MLTTCLQDAHTRYNAAILHRDRLGEPKAWSRANNTAASLWGEVVHWQQLQDADYFTSVLGMWDADLEAQTLYATAK